MLALLPIVYVCSFFMIGRNIFSLILKIKDFFIEKKRQELKENSKEIFVYIALIFTAVLGLFVGFTMLFAEMIFSFYLYFVVSGMMIYSYMTYTGITFQNKNWIMFVVCILVILTIIILAILLGYYMFTGIID